ncbi:hypothetical protein ACFQAT_12835 [Undibacterium arcticum]|uniref:Transposase n=1 Tax=Undibacterium arcticum TaxID=1762892 RepID=A0ABV7FAF1_9BURK
MTAGLICNHLHLVAQIIGRETMIQRERRKGECGQEFKHREF